MSMGKRMSGTPSSMCYLCRQASHHWKLNGDKKLPRVSCNPNMLMYEVKILEDVLSMEHIFYKQYNSHHAETC